MVSANYYRTFSILGIRSASFQGNVLTIGTGVGILMFYDLRAGKYLESSINSSRTVHLKASKGWVVSFYTLLTGGYIVLIIMVLLPVILTDILLIFLDLSRLGEHCCWT